MLGNIRRPFRLRTDSSWIGLSGGCGEKYLDSRYISQFYLLMKNVREIRLQSMDLELE